MYVPLLSTSTVFERETERADNRQNSSIPFDLRFDIHISFWTCRSVFFLIIQILPFSPLFFHRSRFFVRSFLQVLSSFRSSNCHALSLSFIQLTFSTAFSFSFSFSPLFTSLLLPLLQSPIRGGGGEQKRTAKQQRGFFCLLFGSLSCWLLLLCEPSK